jgi:phage tail-like protein
MSRYGIDYYGLAYYGPDVVNTYSATPFTATPTNYGEITLNWVSPIGAWSTLKLVRNSYGFPVNPWDGKEILSVFNGSDPTTLIDNDDVVQEQYYYYSIFVFETYQFTWVRAANVIGLAVEDYNNQERLYDSLPEVYKVSSIYTVDTENSNSELRGFLNVFGFETDQIQTIIHLLVNRYDISKVNGQLLPLMLKQFGFDYEDELGYQQARILVRDAIQLYQEKGSAQGLREYIKAFSGYAVPKPNVTDPNPTVDGIVVGHNLMLDYNDSSFEEGIGHWLREDAYTFLAQIGAREIKSVSLTSNVATITLTKPLVDITTTTATIENCTLPLFNQNTPVTITATTTGFTFPLTSADVPETRATGTVTPFPLPWNEPSLPTNFPNKTNGTLIVENIDSSSRTLTFSCGYSTVFATPSDVVKTGVPVTEGEIYTFSIYSSANATVRNVTAKIKWFDRFGEYISTTTGTPVANATGNFVERPDATGTAPANAYYAIPSVSIASVAAGEIHYFDAAQFELSSATTDFDEARKIHLTLRATRINELINPHFASPLTPWVVTGATDTVNVLAQEPDVDIFSITACELTSNEAIITTGSVHPYQVGDKVVVSGLGSPFDGAWTITFRTANTFKYSVTNVNIGSSAVVGTVYHAGNALQLTATSTSVTVDSYSTSADYMPIYYPESSYTFSVYGKAISAAETITLSVSWYDDTNTLISTNTSSSLGIDVNWTRVGFTSTSPDNAASASVQIDWSTSVGNILDLDSALFERTSFMLPYFDGENGNDPADLFWEGGLPNAGRSHLYKNRIPVVNRLLGTLDEFVPLGTTYDLYLAQPGT